MSEENIITEAEQEIAKLANGLIGIFKKSVSELDTVILPVAIGMTSALKVITDGDSTDVIGTLIAGANGKVAEDVLRKILDAGVPKLQLAQQFVKSGADSETILANVIDLLPNVPEETRTAFLIEFAGMVAKALADGKLTVAEATQLAQYFYKNLPTSTVPPVVPMPKAA